MSVLGAWLRRRRFAGGALVLYSLLAVAMMGPLAPNTLPMSGARDIANHLSGVIEARNALAEGQFPIRVAPNQNHNERYPIFQFYGNFPYTVGGFAYLLTDQNPYDIWKAEIIVFLVVAGFFTYRLARCLTRQELPAISSGVVFITAPYLLTDIHARFAFPEIISFTLLPVAIYFAWRCFAGRGWLVVVASGVVWNLLTLTHNITFLYGSLFVGGFFLSYAAFNRHLARRWLRVGAAYALGLLLSLWYIIPQQALVPHFVNGLLLMSVQDSAVLTPLGVLFAPAVLMADHLGSIYIPNQEHFGLQIGWILMVGSGLAMCCLGRHSSGLAPQRAAMLRLALLLGLALFLIWSPFDFWQALPQVFQYVQFTYRLLMFVVLFGSLLSAHALARAMAGQMRAHHLAMVVLACGWSASPYLGQHRPDPELTIEGEIAHPEIGRGGACSVFRLNAASILATSTTHADFNWVAAGSGGEVDYLEKQNGTSWALLRAPVAGDALLIEGEVAPTLKSLQLTVTIDDVEVPTPLLPPGPFQWTLPLTPSGGPVRVAVHGDPILEKMPPLFPYFKKVASFALNKLALQTSQGHTGALKLVTAEQIAEQVHWGHPTQLKVTLTEPTLLQLPVVYFPTGMRLEHNGQRVQPRHLGRFLALELPPGVHHIRVRFGGVSWANRVSFAAWMSVALAPLAAFCLAWFKRRSRESYTSAYKHIWLRAAPPRLPVDRQYK